jgi:hypothetical protein
LKSEGGSEWLKIRALGGLPTINSEEPLNRLKNQISLGKTSKELREEGKT